MREIKFRGKRIDNGEWVYGYIYRQESSGCDIVLQPEMRTVTTKNGESIKYEHMVSFDVDPDTVGQYTGLKDKYGTEIYEGDIVKTTALLNDHHQRGTTAVSPVEYWHGATCLSITYVPLSLDFQVSHEIEIISNIHDNPEL